ncbi:MAG TPA: chemotaxis protein CheX [Desulfurivibrionaceae bacterium]|nr:chemotaxis protein CheX [Desulfurivibrionaceae bacterium]
MKVEYLNPFILATKNVLETMAQIQVEPQKPQLKEHKGTFGDVTGIIGMASEEVEGNMVISFTAPCILTIVSKMLMEPPKPEIDHDVIDAVGELTNMICGGAKANLSKMGLNFNLATPTMVSGKGAEIHYPPTAPIVVIPFKTSSGDFVLEASLADRQRH